MFSKFFIERPVLANVIALFTILIGAVSLYALPVAQYPQITPPTVQVTTRYPGATARVLVDTVALPIEQQVNGVEPSTSAPISISPRCWCRTASPSPCRRCRPRCSSKASRPRRSLPRSCRS
jgi:hypothetical protein